MVARRHGLVRAARARGSRARSTFRNGDAPMKRMLLALAVLLGLHSAAWAQFAGGNVYGTTSDESGAALPGATATLTSTQMGTRTTTSGSQGDFRFLNIDPGKYQLVVALTGF